ncbi:MAG: CTP synthase [Geminicoccaceae bacterium]|nr:CTP synthase [Geminicoccaceae bacterium]MCS7268225.1 CTP synthase [Geminicoccaceae bacterium]MCX7629419.1 CTP synthase [Geminicoccaceae bacterium]MDW8125005.1 CTP synthase [Geminicoccaceae bacterium]MDW8341216.1 CTP synthase [Geminicoccaceae bacterium]
MNDTRYVFITGGVVSSLGKGLAAAALGALLQARGYRVRLRKLDPYLNVDPGTMSPYQHGEVFVTDDGAETDLDLGHYERFTGVPARATDSVSAGRIYWTVLTRERRGDYLGATVQVIPHVTNAIKEFITNDTADAEIVICEIGGTVGDIEGLPFLEAIRQMGLELPRGRCAYVHVTLVPFIASAKELKTKPTQHSVAALRGIGIQPDLLLCRTEHPIPSDARRKIALQCSVREPAVIEARDCRSIYEVPLRYHAEGFDTQLLSALGLPVEGEPDLEPWRRILARLERPEGEVRVAIVGKYTGLADAYKSLNEALVHGGIANRVRVLVDWVDAEELARSDLEARLKDADAVLVPGGFGERGVDGKLAAVRFARERKLPFLGICFGMQLACIEAARNIAGLSGASSTEFGPCEHPIVGLLTEWEREGTIERRSASDAKGGTMRLGAYPCEIAPGSLAEKAYGVRRISERHRHRYEVNIRYKELLERTGLWFSGMSPDGRLPEIVERRDHPWFVGVQFHPELKSRPFAPHPLFAAFIAAAVAQSRLV